MLLYPRLWVGDTSEALARPVRPQEPGWQELGSHEQGHPVLALTGALG